MFATIQSRTFCLLLCKDVKIRIFKTTILPVVLDWCKTLSLTLGEQHTLRAFENRVLRRIFRSKGDEVTRRWRKLHMYCWPSIIRMITEDERNWGCGTNGAKRNAYRISVGKPEGKRPLGRARRRWVDNIKMVLTDRMRWYGLD
jgi:hypothetical protein